MTLQNEKLKSHSSKLKSHSIKCIDVYAEKTKKAEKKQKNRKNRKRKEKTQKQMSFFFLSRFGLYFAQELHKKIKKNFRYEYKVPQRYILKLFPASRTHLQS